MRKVKVAISWRIKKYQNNLQKIKWFFKRLFDFSSKQKVDSVTIIVVGRNDNYGGEFSKRLEAVLDWNMSKIKDSELIYIEWNQLLERPSDCDWIVKKYSNARCFVVPNYIHKLIAVDPEKMPVMEYFAKNIGVRRAKNNWIAMINADVFLGTDIIKNMHHLSPRKVYGSHYVSIKWNGLPLSESHMRNQHNRVLSFSAPPDIGSVVGNFILTHKDNWYKATGYDERLNNVRSGVDSNGLRQLRYFGLNPMVIGHHFHLDHSESIFYGNNPSHGSNAFNNIPYRNPDNWGFSDYIEIQINERIWRLEKI